MRGKGGGGGARGNSREKAATAAAAKGKGGKKGAASGAASGGAGAKRRSLEYLFYGQPPVLGTGEAGQNVELLRAVEEGFRAPSTYRELGITRGAICLSNSLAAADLPRVGACLHGMLKEGGMGLLGEGPGEGSQAADLSADEAQAYEAFGRDAAVTRQLSAQHAVARRTLERGAVMLPDGMLMIAKVFLGDCATSAMAGEGGATADVVSAAVAGGDLAAAAAAAEAAGAHHTELETTPPTTWWIAAPCAPLRPTV